MKNQLKNITIIIVLVLVFILSFFMFGCEKQKIKNELIEFDKQYYAIAEWDELKILDNKLQEFGQVFYNDVSTVEEVNNIEQKVLDLEEILLEKLRSLEIPEPLDEFYQKKIQQLSYDMQRQSISIQDYENFKQGNWVPEDNEKMHKTSDELSDKIEKLYWECDTIRREVYRKYGLDDLLIKYQK